MPSSMKVSDDCLKPPPSPLRLATGGGIVGRRRPDLDRHSFVPPRTPRYAPATARRVRLWSVPGRFSYVGLGACCKSSHIFYNRQYFLGWNYSTFQRGSCSHPFGKPIAAGFIVR